MTELEKVCKGLMVCISTQKMSECVECPYYPEIYKECYRHLCEDALALLKEQVPRSKKEGYWIEERWIEITNDRGEAESDAND